MIFISEVLTLIITNIVHSIGFLQHFLLVLLAIPALAAIAKVLSGSFISCIWKPTTGQGKLQESSVASID